MAHEIVLKKKAETDISITKVDEENQMVFGFFNVNKIDGELVEDLQGHLMETKELEKGAYDFVLNARDQGESHTKIGVGSLVESFMFTKEKTDAIVQTVKKMGVKDPVINLGIEGWWGGFHVTDPDTWDKVKKGNYPMFSVGGKCEQLVEVTED